MYGITLTRKQWNHVCNVLLNYDAPHEKLLADYIYVIMGKAQGEITLYFRQYDFALLLPIAAVAATQKET